MGVKHPRPHTAATHKTHHQTGYHKPVRNPTTNYAKDSHRAFCERCLAYHKGFCPETWATRTSRNCAL